MSEALVVAPRDLVSLPSEADDEGEAGAGRKHG
jgi:hypothetical protein